MSWSLEILDFGLDNDFLNWVSKKAICQVQKLFEGQGLAAKRMTQFQYEIDETNISKYKYLQ